MDDNTTKVLLTSIALAFVLAIMLGFDRVSLRIERLKIDIFGLPKVSANLLKVALHRRRRSNRRRINASDDIAAPLPQGSFAWPSGSMVVPGNHDIDLLVITHPDDDHLYDLRYFLPDPHHGSR